MGEIKLVHFFSYRYAIRFHISNRLLALGWQKANRASDAILTDQNLTLNDEISKNFEYKHLLAQLVAKYCPGIMPVTYCINDNNYSKIFAKIIYDFYMPNGQYQQNIPGVKWILKPSMLNNGDEIKLFNNIDELKKYYASSKRLGGDQVLQQYVPNPHLIDGKKYTIRIPVVLTNYAGIFINQQGYVNISAHPFDLNDGFENKKVHITNYVLDGEFANIEQRALKSLENYDLIFQQASEIVLNVVKALIKFEPTFLKPQNTKVFEIFGFDFILDQNQKLWLLEINQGPDMPTFEENKLNDILWDKFWTDIIDEFVLPISLSIAPKTNFANFKMLMSSSDCYSRFRAFLHRCFTLFQ